MPCRERSSHPNLASCSSNNHDRSVVTRNAHYPFPACLSGRETRDQPWSPLRRGIAPCFVELCEAVVAVNDVKRPSQFGQERDCLFPFRSERQARTAMPEAACKL